MYFVLTGWLNFNWRWCWSIIVRCLLQWWSGNHILKVFFIFWCFRLHRTDCHKCNIHWNWSTLTRICLANVRSQIGQPNAIEDKRVITIYLEMRWLQWQYIGVFPPCYTWFWITASQTTECGWSVKLDYFTRVSFAQNVCFAWWRICYEAFFLNRCVKPATTHANFLNKWSVTRAR